MISIDQNALRELIEQIVEQKLAAITPRPERLDAEGVAARYNIALGTARNWMGSGRIPTHGPARGRYCLASELDGFDRWAERRRELGLPVSAAIWQAENDRLNR